MWDESIGPEDEYPQQPAGLVTTGFPQHRTTHNIPFQCLECLYSHSMAEFQFNVVLTIPEDPCMEYLPTLTPKVN